MARILVVDDEPKVRRLLTDHLTAEGHRVATCETFEEAAGALERDAVELLITDVRLPGRSGLDLLRHARRLQPELPCVVITAYGSVSDAVRAVKLGAADYLEKPFALDALTVVVSKTLEAASIRAEHEYLIREAGEGEPRAVLVGSSPAMREVHELIGKVGRTRSGVLVVGESGTGKELVAQAVHQQGQTRDRPLIRVSCPGIPAELFESELFGHVKGAFTGASETRKGKFELADGGSILLDEVAELPLALQPKLLRVLEDHKVVRVGGSAEIEVEVRVIAATNRDLEAMVREGRFREDLFYRLNVFPIRLPPLRERKEDLEALACHLLDHLARQCSLVHRGLSGSALDRLRGYSWPGNVRELRNVLERALILSGGGTVEAEHVTVESPDAADGGPQPEGASLADRVHGHKVRLILEALRQSGWRKKAAAERLGLSPRALSHYVTKYGLDRYR